MKIIIQWGKNKEVFIQLKETKYRERLQDILPRLRRQISLETNAIQIQTNSPGAEEAVYQEICPSLLGPAKLVLSFSSGSLYYEISCAQKYLMQLIKNVLLVKRNSRLD